MLPKHVSCRGRDDLTEEYVRADKDEPNRTQDAHFSQVRVGTEVDCWQACGNQGRLLES